MSATVTPERIDPQPHGLGLGLSLCARIAEGLGGRLLAESQPGKGSRFTLSFPDRLVGSGGVSDVAFDYARGLQPHAAGALGCSAAPGVFAAQSGLSDPAA